MKCAVIIREIESGLNSVPNVIGVTVGANAVARAWDVIENLDYFEEIPDILTTRGARVSCVDIIYVENTRIEVYRGADEDHANMLYYVKYTVSETETKF